METVSVDIQMKGEFLDVFMVCSYVRKGPVFLEMHTEAFRVKVHDVWAIIFKGKKATKSE